MDIEREELENAFNYLLDKVELCYKEEVKIFIEKFLNERGKN